MLSKNIFLELMSIHTFSLASQSKLTALRTRFDYDVVGCAPHPSPNFSDIPKYAPSPTSFSLQFQDSSSNFLQERRIIRANSETSLCRGKQWLNEVHHNLKRTVENKMKTSYEGGNMIKNWITQEQFCILKPRGRQHWSKWKSEPDSNNFWWQIESRLLPQGNLRLLAQKIALGGVQPPSLWTVFVWAEHDDAFATLTLKPPGATPGFISKMIPERKTNTM